MVLLIGSGVGWIVISGERGPVIPKGKGDRCVAETDFMRRNHMDLIIHQRDETVIRGIRDEPFSLVECVDCHVQRDSNNKAIRIDAKDQFCASCHEFVAVKIDCFGCHAALPDENRQDTAKLPPDQLHQDLLNDQHWAFSQRVQTGFDSLEGHNQNERKTPASD